MAPLQRRTARAPRWTARLSLATIDYSRRSALAHDVVPPPDAMIVSGHDGAARPRPPGLRQWVTGRRDDASQGTDGQPSAADALSQCSEFGEECQYRTQRLDTRAGAATLSSRLQERGARMADQTAKPVIFISYSHDDEPKSGPEEDKWLSYVLYHLYPGVKNGVFQIWVDEDMPGGEKWKATIAAKLNACDICILLVSPNSLASDYVIDVEVETIRERQKQEYVPLFPIVIKPFAPKAVPWLTGFNLRPPNGEALRDFPQQKERDEKMIEIVNEIVEIVDKIAEKKKAAVAATLQIRQGQIKVDLGSIEFKGEGHLRVDMERVLIRKSPRSVEIDTVHLPETPYECLVGRDEELERLDEAWADPAVNVFSLVAEGGAGKSALVNEWLTRMQATSYRGSDAVLGWSFYSQGTKERATSADQFLNWALGKLAIKLETRSASAKAEAIAEALAKRRVLLLLDGVEPLQHGPGPQTGQLKDLGLRALLRRFAAVPPGEPHGLIVITSRLAVADIARWKDSATPVLEVEKLSNEAGAALLRDNGVWGTDKELKAASHEFAGHPLALGLLAGLLKEQHFGDVRRRDRIRAYFADSDNPRYDHARRVMESYDKEWLAGHPVLQAIINQSISSCLFLLTGNPCANCKTT